MGLWGTHWAVSHTGVGGVGGGVGGVEGELTLERECSVERQSDLRAKHLASNPSCFTNLLCDFGQVTESL